MNEPQPSLVLCPECDWLMRMPARGLGETAHCARCAHHMAPAAQPDMQATLAWASAALVMLALVFVFDFLSFWAFGVGHTMSFFNAVQALVGYDYPGLALLVLATTVVLPGVYLACLTLLCVTARSPGHRPWAVRLARVLRPMEPWMMSDVFIVGVLVSLTKIVTLADIHIGAAFVVFCLYSLLLLRTLTSVDWESIWQGLTPTPAPLGEPGRTGASQHLIACSACTTPMPDRRGQHCPRCGAHAVLGTHGRLQVTWALLVTACIAYIPANIYPMMVTMKLGRSDPQTLIGGVVHLFESGSWPIAIVIFLASIVVPIGKIIALAWLCLAGYYKNTFDSRRYTRFYRLVDKIGRWSMIDVYVVSVLAALVQARPLMAITPGPGILAFAVVVVITMIAALTFDARVLWPDRSRHA